MPREHARILCSVWRPGDDFRDRSAGAQRLYFLVLSQREINNAGLIPLMVSKWARCSTSTTVEDIERDLAELVEHRYFIVDRDTEELLVRTFIRGDGIAKQPNMLKSALRAAAQIESDPIRRALARELVRIGQPDAIATARELDPTTLREPFAEPKGRGSSTDVGEPPAKPSSTPEKNPSLCPAGWGGGRGRGSVPSEGGQVGETPPRPSERCSKHTDDESPGPCGPCGAARRRAERWDAEQETADRAARTAWRAAVDACDQCDENGKLELPDGRLARHHDLVGATS